jgi:hypothetical protein
MSDVPPPPKGQSAEGEGLSAADAPPAGDVPVLAPTWKRGCGLTIMILGIMLTAFSGLCTAGMTISDISSGGGGGGDLNLSGVQYVVGGPFILIGALMWWGGRALSKAKPNPPGSGPPAPPAS